MPSEQRETNLANNFCLAGASAVLQVEGEKRRERSALVMDRKMRWVAVGCCVGEEDARMAKMSDRTQAVEMDSRRRIGERRIRVERFAVRGVCIHQGSEWDCD